MKKQQAKESLKLKKQTVRHLAPKELGVAIGGMCFHGTGGCCCGGGTPSA